MDSQKTPHLPALSPPQPEPGSEPLRNVHHERFAVARAAMFGLLESAREAGYATMTAGNAAKIDRMPTVRARIRYLAGDTANAVRELRMKVATKLNIIRDVSMYDFVRMEKDPAMIAHLRSKCGPEAEAQLRAKLEAMEKSEAEIEAAVAAMPTPKQIEAQIKALPILPFLDLSRIASLAPEEQREILSAAKLVKMTENGPQLELHSPLEAIAQLRKMSGLDAPSDVKLTGALTLEALVGASYGVAAKQIEGNESRTNDAAE
jgi:hypothetical protein